MFIGHDIWHTVCGSIGPFSNDFPPIGPSVTAVSGLIILAGRETDGPNPKRKDVSRWLHEHIAHGSFQKSSSNYQLIKFSQKFTNQYLFQNISKISIHKFISSQIPFKQILPEVLSRFFFAGCLFHVFRWICQVNPFLSPFPACEPLVSRAPAFIQGCRLCGKGGHRGHRLHTWDSHFPSMLKFGGAVIFGWLFLDDKFLPESWFSEKWVCLQ